LTARTRRAVTGARIWRQRRVQRRLTVRGLTACGAVGRGPRRKRIEPVFCGSSSATSTPATSGELICLSTVLRRIERFERRYTMRSQSWTTTSPMLCPTLRPNPAHVELVTASWMTRKASSPSLRDGRLHAKGVSCGDGGSGKVAVRWRGTSSSPPASGGESPHPRTHPEANARFHKPEVGL
jgi:hypothetical protein